jgi:hypothetical protein
MGMSGWPSEMSGQPQVLREPNARTAPIHLNKDKPMNLRIASAWTSLATVCSPAPARMLD